MSSEAPPRTRTTTKYEDIPPRFRKVWILGHAEKVQKKLDAPIEDFSFTMPLRQSKSDANLPESNGTRTSRSRFVGVSGQNSSSSTSPPPLNKRIRTTESSLSKTGGGRSGEGGLLEKEIDTALVPIAYNGRSSMQQIIDSVVSANVARSTPPTSRSNSPLGDSSPHSKYRRTARSRPATRTNSPNTGTRPGTPVPSGWTPLTSRHSLRRFDVRPRGPRHLEYDYNEARKEFQGAAYFALGQYGYVPPKGVAKYKAPTPGELPSMSDLRKIPEFAKACKRLDAADRCLEEAIARGETWDNTPIPNDYLQFSLEDLIPEDFCIQREENSTAHERSRSSVTLEEAAGQLKSSLLTRSWAASTSAPTSASASEKETESAFADEARSSQDVSTLAHMTLSDDKPSSSTLPSTSYAIGAKASAEVTPDEARDASVTGSTVLPEVVSRNSTKDKGVLITQPGRKRSLEETENNDESSEHGGTNMSPITNATSRGPIRSRSPGTAAAPSEKVAVGSLGRTESESTSGSGSGFGGGRSTRGSPPTSMSSTVSNETRPESRRGRVSRMRGRGRGDGKR